MVDIALPYYLARPTEPVRAGVVVIQEANGITPQLLRVVERLAGEGYAALAPDVYFRSGGPSATQNYRDQLLAVDMDQMLGDLATAAGVLRSMGAQRVGVMGFCMGGHFTWHAALHSDGWDAACGFYGSKIAKDLGEPRCPTLLFFGGSDIYMPTEDIDKVVAHHADTFVYPEAGHGFMRDGSEDFAPEAAADAWARVLAHFEHHLRPAT